MPLTKREEVTKQGFYKILWRKLRPRESLLSEFIHSSGWGGGERLFEFDWEEEGVGAYSRLGAYWNKYGMYLKEHTPSWKLASMPPDM